MDIILYNYFINKYLMPSIYEIINRNVKYANNNNSNSNNINLQIQHIQNDLKNSHNKIHENISRMSYFSKLVEYIMYSKNYTFLVNDYITWNKNNLLDNTINPYNKVNLQDISSWYKGLFYNVDSELYNELKIDSIKTLSTSDIVLLNLMDKCNKKFNEIDIKFPKLSDQQLLEIIASPDMDEYQINDCEEKN